MRHGLEKLFAPKNIAAIGVSDREGTVGHALIINLLNSDFKGNIYPVNPGHKRIQGLKSYASVTEIRDEIDLAIIAAPAVFVPGIVKECGESGIRAVLIISAGFKESGEKGKALFEEITQISKQYNIRILGPNCVGFINPSIGLNASFAANTARPGNIAFVSQSGALCTAILDWANDQNVGFSHFVSIGSMLDISFDDLIDYFGTDAHTSCILIYMESLKDPRRFMSAARSFARHKPIIVLKAGKSEEGARASLSHTGSMAGNDEVFSTAFRRAGILQVETIQQLFDCAQALAMQPIPKGNRLAIVTNAGGPGVLATDYLMTRGGKLSELEPQTLDALDSFLPEHWSHSNPVDVLGDASAEKYCKAVQLCAKDKNTDAILAILVTQGVTDPNDVAKALIAEKIHKPILACWLGEGDVLEGRETLEQGRIPNYRYPENVVDVFLKMHQYSTNLEMLYETPPDIPADLNPEKEKAKVLIRNILASGRHQLSEEEAKQMLEYYEIPVPEGKVVHSNEEAAHYAAEIGFPVVMKVASPDIGHKSDIGAVITGVNSETEAVSAYENILANSISHYPEASIDGVRVEKMIRKRYELLFGAKKDPIFGPVIVFGSGGVLVELFRDMSMGLPPLNMALAKNIINSTRVYKLLKGYRGMPGVDIKAIQFLLVKFAYMVMDLPEIREIDINPFAVDETGGLALDAHIVLDPDFQESRTAPYQHLVISPYPVQYKREFIMKDGRKAILRPIRPEDEPLEAAMFSRLSKQSIYFRFFGYYLHVDHKMLIRFTQIDYDREMAIIAELEENGEKKMAGVVRLISDAWNESAEYAIVVADPWQRQGLGNALTEFILEIARERGIREVHADVLDANSIMSSMLQERGFEKRQADSGVHHLVLDIALQASIDDQK